MKKKIAAAAALLFAVLFIVAVARGCGKPAEEPQQPTEPTAAVLSHKIDVPYIGQGDKYPTGCESVSAVMALNYAGVDITVDRFIEEYLPQSYEPYTDEDGSMGAESPFEYFIGSPYYENSYGCYAPVLKKAMESAVEDSSGAEINAATSGSAGRVTDLSGSTLEALCSDYIDRDIPVILWASIKMQPLKDTVSWILPDGSEFTWKSPEHCLVLVGYDDQHYIFNDPEEGKDVPYLKADVRQAYETLYSQALAVVNN